MTDQSAIRREKKIARMRKYLIETTEELIQDDGFNAVTLRKIGDETGYNTATIYNYFKDLNELLLYSSVKFLKTYNRDLAASLNEPLNAMERYIRVFRIFCKHTFAYPDIYYNMFYGKHGKNLGEILQKYYALFPEEMGSYDQDISNMLNCGDAFERERYITSPIFQQGFATEEDVRQVCNLAIYTHQYFLQELCENKNGVTPDIETKRYEDAMLFLLRKIKLPGTPPVAGVDA